MKCCRNKIPKPLLIIIGIVLILAKVFALVDLYKKRESFSIRKKVFLTILILIFPPAPFIYLVAVTFIPKKDEEFESVNLNKEGLL